MYSIVIPNRYESAISPLLKSIKEKIPAHPACIPPIIIVADGHDRNYGYKMVQYDEIHFAFSRAANLGIKAAPPQADIILLNDDCVLLEWNFFERFAQFARDTDFGILSPLIVGCVGNPLQRWHERNMYWRPQDDFMEVRAPHPVCFPCVYIKRSLLDKVGLMNEWIAGYGNDDGNMCQRARDHGFRTGVTQRFIIQHGDGSRDMADGRGRSWSVSFVKRYKTGTPQDAEIRSYHERLVKERKEGSGLNEIVANNRVRYFKE